MTVDIRCAGLLLGVTRGVIGGALDNEALMECCTNWDANRDPVSVE